MNTTDSCTICWSTYPTTTERLAAGIWWCSRECRSIHRRVNAARDAVRRAGTPEERDAAGERLHAAREAVLVKRAPNDPVTREFIAFRESRKDAGASQR